MKDRFNVEGLETACGYIGWLGVRKDADSEGVLVKTLRRNGAIMIAKTSVPMSMLVSHLSTFAFWPDEAFADGRDQQ